MENYMKKLLEDYSNGTCFFNALDDFIRNDINTLIRIKSLIEVNKCSNLKIITSGAFGDSWNNFMHSDILCEGNLRCENLLNLSKYKYLINKQKFIFIDDSIYKSRTKYKVLDEISKFGGELIATFVAYDGSKINYKDVFSLYRYFDNYNFDGTKKDN